MYVVIFRLFQWKTCSSHALNQVEALLLKFCQMKSEEVNELSFCNIEQIRVRRERCDKEMVQQVWTQGMQLIQSTVRLTTGP
jgi:hypothetical protein